MRILRILLPLCMLITFLVSSQNPVGNAQVSTEAYFEDTGHYVYEPFYSFYLRPDSPEILFGSPLTEQFTEKINGKETLVQYFQKVKMIVDENGDVQLDTLGKYLLDGKGYSPSDATNASACKLITETNKYVCYAFLQFYNANKEFLGPPLANYEIREKIYVQYFRNVRLEWHPNLAEGQRMIVSDLGKMHFDQSEKDTNLLLPEKNASIPAGKIMPQVGAFITRPLIKSGEKQTLNVVVVDQFYQPMAHVPVKITVYYPNGDVLPYRLPDTDKDGLSKISFDVLENIDKNEIVEIKVTITPLGREFSASTWFRIWY